MALDHRAGYRQVDGAAADAGTADLDPGDLAALGGGQDDGRWFGGRGRGGRAAQSGRGQAGDGQTGGGGDGRVQREAGAADVGDQVGQRLGEPPLVGDHLDRGGVHREAHPAGADQLAGLLDGPADHLVQADRHPLLGLAPGLAVLRVPALGRSVLAGLGALVLEHPVDQLPEPAALVGEPAQGPVGLRPELSGGVGGEPVQPLVQRVQRAAELALQDGGEVLVAGDQGEFAAAVGEGHHRADQLVAVPDRGGGEVDGDRAAVLAPEHGAAHPVLAPGGQGVQQCGLLQRQRGAVGPGVLDQRVQFAPAQLARPVLQDVRGGRVDQDAAAFEVHAEHALGGGPQDHLGLLVLAAQLGLDAQPSGEVADQQQEQVGGRGGAGAVAVGVVRGAPVALAAVGGEVVAGDLDREGRAVGAVGGHPDRAVEGVAVAGGRAHRAGDAAGVELGQQAEHAHADQRGARRLQRLDRRAVGVHDGAVAVHQQQRVGQGVEYGVEASSASDRPAAHVDRSPRLRAAPPESAVSHSSLRRGRPA